MRGNRRACFEESRSLERMPERLVVLLENDEPDGVLQRREVIPGESLGQPEIQERHSSSTMEQVVARMRVAVEGVETVQAAEDKSIDRLRGEVFLPLAPCQQFLEARAHDELGGQHPSRAELLDHMRDMNDWVSLVIGCKQLLVLRLAAIVDLLFQPLAQLVHQRLNVQTTKSRADDL